MKPRSTDRANGAHPKSFRLSWAIWVEGRRTEAGLTKRRLAELCEIDAANINNFEVDCLIPSRDVVLTVGKVLGSATEACLAAGFVPSLEEVSTIRRRLRDNLSPACGRLVEHLAQMTHAQQDAITADIRGALEACGTFSRLHMRLKAVSNG